MQEQQPRLPSSTSETRCQDMYAKSEGFRRTRHRPDTVLASIGRDVRETSMKFCLLVPEEFASHHRQHSFEITGLLQWGKALGGDIKTLTEFDGGYDWVMTNVSSTESEYISFIHQVDPDAKVIACFDYGFDVVNQYFVPAAIARIKDVMNRADVVFSVNKNQQAWMQEILPDTTIHYSPHPTAIE